MAAERGRPSPWSTAWRRGAARRRALAAAAGGCVDAAAFAARLRARPGAAVLLRRHRRGGLLALADGDGLRFPAWQAWRGRLLPGLGRVLAALRAALDARDDAQAMRFLLGRNPELDGRRPLALLRAGRLAPVLDAARAYPHS